jgi:hypothetical protein
LTSGLLPPSQVKQTNALNVSDLTLLLSNKQKLETPVCSQCNSLLNKVWSQVSDLKMAKTISLADG